jgi:hypothetical protein
MVRWASSSQFGGGCCPAHGSAVVENGGELGRVYRDICECCSEKTECRNAEECKCPEMVPGEVPRVRGCQFVLVVPDRQILRNVAFPVVQMAINVAAEKSSRLIGYYQGLLLRTQHRKHDMVV